jgi:membrane protein involved in D-alanine export
VIPYADFLYFGVLLYVAVPTVGVGLLRRGARYWLLLATAGMLVVQYFRQQAVLPHLTVREIWLVLGYAVLQWGVAGGLLLSRRRAKKRGVFYLASALALLPLAAIKFVPLFAPSYQVGFLGISYVTFRSLDVIFGIQDGVISTLPLPQYLAYLLFFPTISSGPVDRYRRFAADWQHQRSREELWQDLDGAVQRLMRGFLYKFILAVLIKRYCLDPMATGQQFGHIVAYMYAYSFYLFFDFAGYSAFATGVSWMLGVHPPENFDRPFLASSIRDFWNRWHISLSFWFRDHVYTRFVFAAAKGHWFKSRYLAGYLGYFVSMGLMGLWHGTAWHYLLYGAYHGALMAGYDWFVRWNKQHQVWGESWAWRAAAVLLTFNVVCFGLLLFSGRLG